MKIQPRAKKYKIEKNLFPALTTIIHKGITKSKATNLAKKYNLECDAYEYYIVKEDEN